MTYKATYRDVKQIVLTQMPLTTYDLNESLDVSDGRIRVDFADGTSKEVPMTTDMVEGFSSKKTGTKTLKVTYAGCTLNYEIRVSDELTKKQENMQQRAAAVIKPVSYTHLDVYKRQPYLRADNQYDCNNDGQYNNFIVHSTPQFSLRLLYYILSPFSLKIFIFCIKIKIPIQRCLF